MIHRLLYSTIILLLLASPVLSSSITYVYDELDRLHEVTLENGQKITYEYDQIGNMISKTPSGNVVTITASATAGGSIYPNGSITTTVGGRKQYSIAPSADYVIESLYVDGVSQGAINSYTFNNIAASHTITANFVLNHYTITATAGSGGTISPSGPTTLNYNSNQGYTIIPSTGYHIADVVVDGVSKGAVTSFTFSNVSAPHTISATFAMSSYTITASAGIGGTISPSGPTTLNFNSNQGYTITPSIGYHIADVLVDGNSMGPIPNYGFLNLASNHSISASFAINQFPVTFTAGPNGSLTGSTSQSVNYGGSTTAVTAVPAADGSSFVNWTGSGGFVTNTSNPLIVSNVTESQNITANFRAPDPVTPPDLVMNPGFMLMVPANLTVGQQYFVDATTSNLGTVAAGPFYVNIYLSTDSTITTSDTFLGQVVPGESSIIPITIPPIAHGQYYVGAIADATNMVPESDETNNTYTYNYGNPCTIENVGDLAVTDFTSPANGVVGQNIPVQVTIKNQGSSEATNFYVEIYLSTDNVITTDDYYRTSAFVNSLAVGASTTIDFVVTTNAAHAWPYIGVIVNPWENVIEQDLTNNTKTNAITITLQPATAFSATPTSGEGPLSVNFTDQSQGATSWLWNFGDGITSTEKNPSHTYLVPGVYTVTLTASNTYGSSTNTKSGYITVNTCTNTPFRVLGKSGYSTLQAAYDSAVDGDIIQGLALSSTANFATNRNISVTIDGGYVCDYSANPYLTYLLGSATLSSGTVTLKNFQLLN